MTPDVSAPPRRDPARKEPPGKAESPATDPVARLRAILFGREKETLRRLEKRIDDPEALRPVVERALTTSVKRDPRPLADALFPIMGPAIRRAISQALAGMMQSVNQALEHTFSLQGLAWRWEAFRTGASFGEVVLRHTLRYRVEQVFLVHRETGLLLQHVMAPSESAPAADMVAGMLTAINDFARDSFKIGQEETLEAIQVGEFTLWLEQGGRAVVAAVIRGHAPVEYRADLQRVIEAIEADHAEELQPFNGDTAPFTRSRSRLESLLQAESSVPASAARQPWRSWLVLGAAIILLLVFGIPALFRQRQWNRAVEALRSTPGIVVTHTGREAGRFLVQGLRDPLAPNTLSLVTATGLDSSRVSIRMEPYLALIPEFIGQRAAGLLKPPRYLDVSVASDTLILTGAAPVEWWQRARSLAPAVTGISSIREVPQPITALSPFREQADRIAGIRFYFGVGQSGLDSAGQALLATLAPEVATLDSLAQANNLVLSLLVTGSADDVGTLATNQVLRRDRAQRIKAALNTQLAHPLTIETAEAPEASARADESEAERAQHRAVWIAPRLDYPASDAP